MAFTSKLQTLYFAMNILGIVHLLIFRPSEGTSSHGFTIDLIHRDSPSSPFYNQSSTHLDRLRDAFQRSLNRVNHLKSALAPTSEIDAPMTHGGGEYLMRMSLGTPPIEIVGIADTGSDLTWTQCKPCIECYKQIPPLFDSTHSSSYKTIPCQTDSCNALDKSFCRNNQTCAYSYSYADGSSTGGVLATDTVTLGSSKSASFPHIPFGCSNNNTGTFDKAGSGIIALGRGKLSLVSQLGGSIGKKFSYCLAPTSSNKTSKISFGSDSVASDNGRAIVTTPIITKSSDNYYYISLDAFSVGNQTIPYNGDTKTDPDNVGFEGNIIIDSGTTYTLVLSHVFDELVSALDKVLSVEKVKDPNNLFSLCYKDDGHNIQLPTITAHIKGGDLILQPLNTFSWVTDDVVCLAMISSDFPVYGNLAQTNFKVGFDLETSILSFQPADCTQQW